MTTDYLVAFGVGLLSSLHCVGMCGGIIGALGFSLPAELRARPPRLAAFMLAYNLGRICSYGAAGALFGWFGAALATLGARVWLAEGLRLAASLAFVCIGLYISGLLPRFAAVERLGAPLWRRLEPLGRRLLPVRTLPQAALFGAVWGWLPCSMVYSMLIASPAQGSAVAGALYMTLFGAGTLPALLGTGLFAGRLYRLGQDRRFQAAAGLLVAALGLSTLVFREYNS